MRHRLYAIALSVLMVAMVNSSARQQQLRSGPVSRDQPSTDGKRNLKGVPNFGQVSSQLYRGGQPTTEGFESLAHEGVGVVVDLRGDQPYERQWVTKLGMQYVPIPWHCYNPQDKQMAEFLKVVRENAAKKVFVHCRLGSDRTGMMVAAYRMAEQGWSAEDAGKEMAAYGFSSVHHMICPLLSSYEASFPSRFKANPIFETLRAPPQASH